ncbi:hypothetical protein EDB89DRAFT_856612 [Lactarius sanguifluus]|nr:hypothetical protein EDB89DRAFT_856612 [Lactarius sanguifluus]
MLYAMPLQRARRLEYWDNPPRDLASDKVKSCLEAVYSPLGHGVSDSEAESTFSERSGTIQIALTQHLRKLISSRSTAGFFQKSRAFLTPNYASTTQWPPRIHKYLRTRFSRWVSQQESRLLAIPPDKMWSIYLSESEKHDKDISDGWKDDANGVLVFTGLFSATVAAFIIESYKKLSPDSGDQTAFLLQQISQQLSGLSNGTYVRPQNYPTFSPSTSIVCVNAMWILSLIVSITCALLATLMQQWARQYVQLPQLRTTPRERAHVRSFLFFGLKQFRMSYAVELIPTLLHLAVFLFFVGLVIFFFSDLYDGRHNHFDHCRDLFHRLYRADHPSLCIPQLPISYFIVQPLVVCLAHRGTLPHGTLSLDRGNFPRSEPSRRLEREIRTLCGRPRSTTQRWVRKECRE